MYFKLYNEYLKKYFASDAHYTHKSDFMLSDFKLYHFFYLIVLCERVFDILTKCYPKPIIQYNRYSYLLKLYIKLFLIKFHTN